MDERKVCFNPELLAGTDVKSEWYRELIQDITPGSFPTAEEPCVPEETLRTSFVLSELDPQKFEDVLKYRSARPYYQTVACRMAWGNTREESARWSGLSRRLTEEPLNDEKITAMKMEIEGGCEEFALIEMYNAAEDPKLKNEIAKKLLTEWDSVRSTMADNSPLWYGNIADVHGVYSEILPELAKVFYEHFHAAEGSDKAWIARALMQIEGTKAFEYFTNLVLNPKAEYDDRWQAADAIFGAARVDHDAIPYMARLLNAEGRDAQIFDKDGAWKNVHAGDGGILADERLLPTVVQKVREGDLDGFDYRLGYMQKVGEASVPYLIGLLDALPSNFDYYHSTRIFDRLAHIGGDAAIQYMSRYILTAKDHTEKHRLPSAYEAGIAMAESGNSRTQEALLALLDYPMLGDDRLNSLVQSLRNFKPSNEGFFDTKKVVQKLISIAKKDGQSSDIIMFARSSIKEQMNGEYRIGFETMFTDFSEDEQLFLLDLVEPKIDETARHTFLDGIWRNFDNSNLTPAVRADFDERFLDAFRVAIKSGKNMDLVSYLSEDYLSRISEQMWNVMSNEAIPVETYFNIVDDGTVSKKLRMRALAVGSLSLQTGIDEKLLTGYVLNPEASEWLRSAALEQLGVRARKPAFKSSARAALQRILPIPPAIQSRTFELMEETR